MGATDTKGKGKSGIRQGAGRIILVTGVVSRVAIVMVVDMFLHGEMRRPMVLAAIPWTAMKPPGVISQFMAPARSFSGIVAMVGKWFAVKASMTIIVVGPGASRKDEHKTD